MSYIQQPKIAIRKIEIFWTDPQLRKGGSQGPQKGPPARDNVSTYAAEDILLGYILSDNWKKSWKYFVKDYENHFSIDFHQYYFLLLKNGLIYQKIATFDSIENINNPYGVVVILVTGTVLPQVTIRDGSKGRKTRILDPILYILLC